MTLTVSTNRSVPPPAFSMWMKHGAQTRPTRDIRHLGHLLLRYRTYSWSRPLGLGLGFGCALKIHIVYAAAPSTCSSYPERFDFAPNSTEDVSKKATVRECVFGITQALAALDGIQKPILVINVQRPVPLIEDNVGDTIRIQVNSLMAPDKPPESFIGMGALRIRRRAPSREHAAKRATQIQLL
ncbi:uncharacterized protein BCR38DRAFT_218199 [Pseudomassariella vexata]|uniref:Uncharacterized protein n=1 Tax=Pseudomassariella vexata TaxID=1141098 RepID=A0A1Y2DUK8_9PEZI|nr:uncharacterized protein BCR38DRAFT_218199 [Pseudomassariella vexata]ORY62948.1 hypothetical protein BCR38DRAFT_218199 [Pseudomassariella vexata]